MKTTLRIGLKQASILIIGLLYAGIVAQPATADEGSISFPPGTIGVTESDFHTLKDSGCYYEATPNTVEISDGVWCDPLLARLRDSIIARVEHAGEMYWLNTGDGLPTVNRYVPDGFYSTGHKYYIVSHGIRKHIKPKQARAIVANFTVAELRGETLFTPVNESSWDGLVQTCSEIERDLSDQRDQAPFDVLFNACDDKSIIGMWSSDASVGQLIMRVEKLGQLYYVRPNQYWATVYKIPTTNADTFTMIQVLATPMKKKPINKLVSFNRL